MLQNYKKDFKPYFTGLRQDNNKLKEFFNTDSFILEVREQAKKKIYKIYISWETEVEAENYNEAIIEGAEEWYIGHDHKDFKAE